MLQKAFYFCVMGVRIILAGVLASLFVLPSQAQIEGVVKNREREPLPGAIVTLLPDSLLTSTDEYGNFRFEEDFIPTSSLKIHLIGFKDQRLNWASELDAEQLEIVLLPEEEFLNTVVVVDEHAKQEATLAVDHFSEEFIRENMEGTFAKTIEKLPGISAINVGVGIAKPVIRGLSANRIIVNHNGIKQESQQWGTDHGLEIDQFDVDRVEIIKGPASLQYGSDGLGGVINISLPRIISENTLSGSLNGIHKTNNAHWGGSGNFQINVSDVFFTARYTRQGFADYRVPADQFEYNSFVLPILNQQLKNTAGEEESMSFSLGLKRDWGISRIIYSQYSLDAGLFSGAVGIPRSYALTDDGNDRDLDIPKQEVNHYKISFHQSFPIGEDHFDWNIGLQRNLRQEFSFPEFHSIPSSQIDKNNTLALELELRTLSLDAHYERHLAPGKKTIVGGNVQWQRNARGGFEFLLPNFQTFRGGMFCPGGIGVVGQSDHKRRPPV